MWDNVEIMWDLEMGCHKSAPSALIAKDKCRWIYLFQTKYGNS